MGIEVTLVLTNTYDPGRRLRRGTTERETSKVRARFVRSRWKEKHKRQKQAVLKMEFKKFRNAFIQLPCQIIKTGRKIVYRLLSWNRWLEQEDCVRVSSPTPLR